MKSAKFSLPASILLLAAFVGQGCFYGGGGYHYPTYYAAPQPAYDPPRAYYAPPPQFYMVHTTSGTCGGIVIGG